MLFPVTSTRSHFGEIRGLFRQMDEVFRHLDTTQLPVATRPRLLSQAEFRDDGDEIVLQLDVPGMAERDISIDATSQSLTVRGEAKNDVLEGYIVHRQERGSARFARSWSIPFKIDLEKVRASVKNGVLTIRAAKIPEERPKQITINAA